MVGLSTHIRNTYNHTCVLLNDSNYWRDEGNFHLWEISLKTLKNPIVLGYFLAATFKHPLFYYSASNAIDLYGSAGTSTGKKCILLCMQHNIVTYL